MYRLVLWFFLALPAYPDAVSAAFRTSDVLDRVPNRTTASELADVWLRFHESDLCQGLEAAFVFHEKQMVVNGTILDERSYERFQDMLRPLGPSYEIELHLDHPQKEGKGVDRKDEEKEKNKDNDPPASLWENYELRSFLGDPFARARDRASTNEDFPFKYPPPDEMLKQRLRIYAEQILAWNSELERYAKHIPDLVRMATDTGLKPPLRLRAYAAAAAHAKEVDRLVGKLRANLEPAFPRFHKMERTPPPEKGSVAGRTITDRAVGISEFGESISLRVYHFIHPEQYTVGLDELRRPGLLVSLKDFQAMNADFMKALAKAK